jgi:hypothetical protein
VRGWRIWLGATGKRCGAVPRSSRQPGATKALLSGLLLLVSCGAARGPLIELGLMGADQTPATYCGLSESRFEFQYRPQTGYVVLFLVDSYRGLGAYADLTRDMDKPGGTKFMMHSVGSVSTPVVRGVGIGGTIYIDSIAAGHVTGRIHVHSLDDARPSDGNGFDVAGSWTCAIGPPGSVKTSQPPSAPPSASPIAN